MLCYLPTVDLSIESQVLTNFESLLVVNPKGNELENFTKHQ